MSRASVSRDDVLGVIRRYIETAMVLGEDVASGRVAFSEFGGGGYSVDVHVMSELVLRSASLRD